MDYSNKKMHHQSQANDKRKQDKRKAFCLIQKPMRFLCKILLMEQFLLDKTDSANCYL